MKVKSILLVGLGMFGVQVAQNLNDLGHEIMAVDVEEERVNDAMRWVTNAQIGDATKEEFLRTLGVDGYDVCVVAIGGDFQSSLETTALLKEMGAKKVVARAESNAQEKFLRLSGADEVVNPEKQLASWLAIRYSADHIFEYIDVDGEHAIFEVVVPKNWIGKTIGQIDIRKKYDVNIMATKKNGVRNFAVSPEILLTEDMTLLVLGTYKDMQKCFNI